MRQSKCRLEGCLLLCALLLLGLSTGCKRTPILDEAAVNLVDARQAIADGDATKAMELLMTSIDARPNTWAYFERAKLHADHGDDEAAKADIEAGLELDPEHSELVWLQKQMKKPKAARFKGKDGQPPSLAK